LNELSEIKVYPTPTADRIYVDLNDFSRYCSFELFDAQGRLIEQTKLPTNNNFMSLKRLHKGMYFYRLTVDNKLIKSGKIMKE